MSKPLDCLRCEDKGAIIHDEKVRIWKIEDGYAALKATAEWCDCQLGQRLRFLNGKVDQWIRKEKEREGK
jgi:hypothetical protein